MKNVLKNLLLLSSSLAVTFAVFGKDTSGSSGGQKTPSFIPIEQAQRVLVFNHERHTVSYDGQILVCRWPADATRWPNRTCLTQTGSGRSVVTTSSWLTLDPSLLPGYEVSGIQYFFSGSSGDYPTLVVYFQKVRK